MTEPAPPRVVKCVAWDLDGTLWEGVALERPDGDPPPLMPDAVTLIDTLASRGIVSSVASRTAPSVGAALAASALRDRVLVPQLGWDDKSTALRRIADELGIGTGTLALVDEDPYERAEVAARLPEALVLSPQELRASIDDPPFAPAVVTADAHARVGRYREELDRRAAEAAAPSSREDFLRSCDLRLEISAATGADAERVAELSARTARFNATGKSLEADVVRAAIGNGVLVPVARLTDRFGDYGLVGAAAVEREPNRWRIRHLMVSCRAAGRGVAPAFATWIAAEAARAGARETRIDVRPRPENLELRLALRGLGFRAADSEATALVRSSSPAGPEPPDWLEVRGSARRARGAPP